MKFVVNGGKKLEGTIKLAGAKNATNKMMVASLLTSEPCELENFPNIDEVDITAELCEHIGTKIEKDGDTLKLHTPEILNTEVSNLTRRNRLPILTLGPLLARVGKAKIPIVGGDKIGPRPVDMHIEALQAMGAVINFDDEYYSATAPDGLRGTRIHLRYPSVMATENIILAGTLAKGRTVINNAATEPEIVDLIKMLQKMGAIIEMGADRSVYIDGVSELHGAKHKVLPDRNEAASFASLAVASGGNILVEGAIQEHIMTFLNALRKVGGEYEVLEEGIRFWRAGPLKGIEVETDTHPGFMTDWQQPFLVLLTQASGSSIVHETVYEDRFGYVETLNSMGADIKLFPRCLGELKCRFSGQNHNHSALINGPTKLRGVEMKVKDLRAGIANIIAALVAEGESTIEGAEEIDRGYEYIEKRLGNLNADIKRIK
ncbi:MAG: UDP-N-acetylglucosamine 1-carboxyvinyltransferase [Candidatus Colwellbacteria bacterium]